MNLEDKANILLLDIETAPNLAYVWGKYEQDVIWYEREWYIMCFSAKWLGEKTFVRSLPDFKTYRKDPHDDKELILEIHKLLDKADIVVAHNGDMFDLKKISARFSFYNLPPPSPYKTVDTKKIAKKYFNFNSNKLNDLGVHLGLGKKVETGGHELWKKCLIGDKKSWDKMCRYNIQDVDLLYKVYKRFLPWMEHHPTTYSDGNTRCNKCGSANLQARGYGFNKTRKYKRAQCMDCGGWMQIR